ncbi:23S rRNA (uracil(1939)-C(5))-methyltransferase RlmD [Maridesulfovibrio ferrireducens]|uniref:23S rRNA (uracil(1939)-C(5))-methyltransferase RlmD n=1 Tax=Maridesulfovibrio ferrireducens TaxID=246191 RepID=UPI001A2DC69D|nr:23S rRNA (uracil(1939)-C(5))-methyltransferase RlmD [Maridesulfovibrio ferrireducens]MBI9109744.1 23S rRNA (uracil(1939)-C(5))-methyltransferase RlmD [Maridesulfovibrio ferrireducens]
MTNENNALAKGSTIEIEIESLAFGGQGIARHEGLTIFVDNAVPGQVLSCEITKLKKRFAFAKRLEVITHSKEEATPFCEHFGTCGGCLHQDIDYKSQTYWKGRQVSDTLARIGKISKETDGMGKDTLGSPLETGYRNRMNFSFQGYGDELTVGFKKRGSETEVVSVGTCPLLPESCKNIPAMVQSYCSKSKYGTYRHGKGGYWRKLVVRVSHESGKIMIHVITAPSKTHSAIKGLEELLFAEIPDLKTFAHSTRIGRPDIAAGERLISLKGEPFITETLKKSDGTPVSYKISPNAFFQTNSAGAEVLFQNCLDMAAPAASDVVYDLFCGSGGIGMFMASSVKKVIGFELSKETVLSARENAELNNIENCQYITANLADKDGIPVELPKPNVIVLDPPRSGVPAPTLARILSMAPEKIIYVSCNPSTLARDAERLEEKYTLTKFSSVDMFPHTAHIECIALLTRHGKS